MYVLARVDVPLAAGDKRDGCQQEIIECRRVALVAFDFFSELSPEDRVC